MTTNARVGIISFIIVVLAIIVAVVYTHQPATTTTPPVADNLISIASYACSSNKTITANYYDGASKPATASGQPPVPGGSVALTLSDGRTMNLSQTISADGARYANADESVIFWNKGRGITFTEGAQQTYTGCIEVAKDPGGLTQVYENGTKGFSIRYPAGYTVNDASYNYPMGPLKSIGGVKFTIPKSMTSGTNLSNDSYISVEEIPQGTTCSATMFLSQGAKARTVTSGDMTYSFASSTDAAAGNRYQESVYAIPGTNPCIAVRYFVHYGVVENYPTGTVKAFDQASLMSQFDMIRNTLVIAQ